MSALELDAMHVRVSSDAPPLIESRNVALGPERRMIGCGALSSMADLSVSPVTTSELAGESYARDSEWSRRTVCAPRQP